MKVTIVGTGYVGLVTGVCFSEKGHSVLCVDKNKDIIDKINSGKSPIYEPGLEALLVKNISAGKLKATGNIEEAVKSADLIFIAVGTPSNNDGAIDLTYVCQVAEEIGKALKEKKEYSCIIVKSTVIPGTTRDVVLPILESNSSKKIGEFGLGMNPEFLREGNAVSDFMNPDRIVLGAFDKKSAQYMEEVYSQFNVPKLITSPTTAELIKYANNALLATLISFSNEISLIAASLPGVDIRDVLKGVHMDGRWSPVINGTKVYPEILKYLWAGCGYGGSCFPKDVSSLEHFAAEQGIHASIIKKVQDVNRLQPANAVSQLERCCPGGLNGKKVAVLGLAFKPNTDDVRESPAFGIIKELLNRGAMVLAHDPLKEARENFLKQLDFKTTTTTCSNTCRSTNFSIYDDIEEILHSVDIVFLVTSWSDYLSRNWQNTVFEHSNIKLFYDGRRVIDPSIFSRTKCKYHGIGYSNLEE